MKKTFRKGRKKTGGRKKGVPNKKLTAKAKAKIIKRILTDLARVIDTLYQ